MEHERPKKAGISQLLVVFLTVLIDLLGFGIVIPLLPIYSKAYGATELELGILFASFSAMQFVFAPFWGRLSDRIGRRPVLVGGLFGTAGSYALFAYADSMALLYLSRCLAGFFGANVSTAQAFVADVTEPHERAKGMGMIGAAFGLGFTFGPLVGGKLVEYSMHLPGLFAAGLSLSAALFGLIRLREPARHEASRVYGLETVRKAFAEARSRTILLLHFLAIFAFSIFESMFIRFGLARFPHVFGLSASVEHATLQEILDAAPIAGTYMFFIGLVAAVIQGGLIRRLVPRFGELKLIVAGPFLLGLSLFVLGAAQAWWVVLVGCALMPCGFGINNPALNGLLSRSTPAGDQGAVLGLNQSLASLARVVGPLVGGLVFVSFGAGAPFFLAAAVLGTATALARRYGRRHAALPAQV